jgi:hypothetical protein
MICRMVKQIGQAVQEVRENGNRQLVH